jgi:hypothetical protein
MNCYVCDSKLIWGGDHSYEDYGLEGEGIVTNLSCSNGDCSCESVLVYDSHVTYRLDDEE